MRRKALEEVNDGEKVLGGTLDMGGNEGNEVGNGWDGIMTELWNAALEWIDG